MDSAENSLREAEGELDEAEQRILVCGAPPPESDMSAEKERDRVLSAVGPFDTLGVRRDCNSADITARYHDLAKKLHSDRHGSSDAAMSKVNAARDELNDPAQRTAYVTNNPLDDFKTGLSRAEQRARCAVEDARRSRVEMMLCALVTMPLEESFKRLGAATPCHLNLTKRLSTPPLQAIIDMAHPLTLERVDVIDELFLEIDDDEEEPAGLNVNQSSRIADLYVSVNGHGLRLPYEILTLHDKGRLVFQDLAKNVLHASDVRFQAVVAQLRESALEHVKRKFIRKKYIKSEAQDLKQTEKRLASAVEEELPTFARTYATWKKAVLQSTCTEGDETERPLVDEPVEQHPAMLM
eukprot:4960303-Prymnesium_polylepis.1